MSNLNTQPLVKRLEKTQAKIRKFQYDIVGLQKRLNYHKALKKELTLKIREQEKAQLEAKTSKGVRRARRIKAYLMLKGDLI